MAYTVVARLSVPALLAIATVLLAIPAQATAQENLAREKPTSQSSVGAWSSSQDPAVESHGAVNGSRTGFGFHTDEEENPWWQVDLGQASTIDEIRVYNRTDGSQSRARTVRVLLSSNGSDWQEIYAHDGTTFNRLTIPANGTQARFVRLQLNEREWFHLAEVEVMGVPLGGPSPIPTVPGQPSANPPGDLPLNPLTPGDIALPGGQGLVPGGDAGTNNNDAAAIPYNCRIDGAIASGDYDAFTFDFPGGDFRAASQGDLNLVADLIRASDGATLARHGTETQQFLIEGDLPADRYILTLRVMFHGGAGDYGVTLGAPGACAVRDLATATGPAGTPTPTSGAPQSLVTQVLGDRDNDELWGDLGDAYQEAGNGTMATGSWAVARILDPNDGEWSGHNPNLDAAVGVILQIGITDDEWIGDLADRAQSAGFAAAARSLYDAALTLDPADREWQKKSTGSAR